VLFEADALETAAQRAAACALAMLRETQKRLRSTPLPPKVSHLAENRRPPNPEPPYAAPRVRLGRLWADHRCGSMAPRRRSAPAARAGRDLEAQGVDALETQQFIHIGIGAGDIRCMTFGGQFDKVCFPKP
jgi:hypothetical protein